MINQDLLFASICYKTEGIKLFLGLLKHINLHKIFRMGYSTLASTALTPTQHPANNKNQTGQQLCHKHFVLP